MMRIVPFENIDHPTKPVLGKHVIGASVSIALLHNELNQYPTLYKAICRHIGSSRQGHLYNADPICVDGIMKNAKYEFEMNFLVEKLNEDRFVRHSRILTLRCFSDNAAEGLQIIVPRKKEVIRAKMAEAFKGFLRPESIDYCVDLYFHAILGRDI